MICYKLKFNVNLSTWIIKLRSILLCIYFFSFEITFSFFKKKNINLENFTNHDTFHSLKSHGKVIVYFTIWIQENFQMFFESSLLD